MTKVRVPLGRTVMTANAWSTLQTLDVVRALGRHESGDWGEALCAEDRKANDWALENGERLLSSYHDSKRTPFWIITEWDRSLTTVLLPEDY